MSLYYAADVRVTAASCLRGWPNFIEAWRSQQWVVGPHTLTSAGDEMQCAGARRVRIARIRPRWRQHGRPPGTQRMSEAAVRLQTRTVARPRAHSRGSAFIEAGRRRRLTRAIGGAALPVSLTRGSISIRRTRGRRGRGRSRQGLATDSCAAGGLRKGSVPHGDRSAGQAEH